MPKSKKTEALLKVVAWFSGLVPLAGCAKLKVRVCQSPATVVVASVSTVRVPSAASSSLRRTTVPASGAHTRIVTLWLLEVINSPEVSDRKVTPAQISAPTVLMTSTAVPEPPAGGAVSSEGTVPPNPVRV